MHDKHRIRAGKVLIRGIFVDVWDPLGIIDEPTAQDEYDSYLGGMYKLLGRSASSEEIIAYLREIETDHMGIKPNEQVLAEVAVRLKAVRW